MEELGIMKKPECIYNVDEKGCRLCLHKQLLVLRKRRKTRQSGCCRTWVKCHHCVLGKGRWISREQNPLHASHKSKPSSVPQGVVDSYSALGHVGGGNRCGAYNLLGDASTDAFSPYRGPVGNLGRVASVYRRL
jgi:hypothetical protein